MSASHYTRSIGFHVLVCEAFGACSDLHPSNWLLPCKLGVWDWVVTRRIFVQFSEFSTWSQGNGLQFCY